MAFNKTACVIGAGPVGLSTAKCCLQEGFNVTIFEQCDKLGGIWNYEDGDIHQLKKKQAYGSAYLSLTTNSSRYLNSFSDFIPRPGPQHATHEEIIQYLKDYASEFKVDERIKYLHKLIDVTPIPNDDSHTNELYPTRWQVSFQTPNGQIVCIFDSLLICAGQYWQPKSVAFPGYDTFSGFHDGLYFHSHYYRKPSQLEIKGTIKNILLIGVGNSAFDIALELGALGKNVIMSSRSGTRLISGQTNKNTPTDEFLWRRDWQINKNKNVKLFMEFNSFSIPLQQACELSGLPKPHPNPIQSHFSIIKNPQLLLSLLKSKNISFKPNIAEIMPHTVLFIDGSSAPIDAIIECTGYDLSFPFMEKAKIYPGIIGERLDLYKNVMHPQYPNFCMIAQVDVLGSMFAVGEMQARWAAGVLRGRIPLSNKEEREKWVTNYVAKVEKMKSKFTNFLNYYSYMESLAKEIGCLPNLDPSREEYESLQFGTTYPFHYRLDGYQKWDRAKQLLKAKL
jgi:dimethylaniline monooxygenase (N-oxide forming)